jgi:hypothetical protein
LLSNGTTASFALNPVQTNPFMEVWFHNGILADNFNGTGFNTGTKILSGMIRTITTSNFAATLTNLQFLDNPNDSGGTTAGKNFWNGGIPPVTATGTLTVTGTGGANMDLLFMGFGNVTLNPSFFPGGQKVTDYTLTPSLGLEYQKVDPSKFFTSSPNGATTADVPSVPVGTVNGFGSAQVDPNTGKHGSDRQVIEIHNSESFTVAPSATAVPEPASLALLTTGALGLLGYGWRRWKQAA